MTEFVSPNPPRVPPRVSDERLEKMVTGHIGYYALLALQAGTPEGGTPQ